MIDNPRTIGEQLLNLAERIAGKFNVVDRRIALANPEPANTFLLNYIGKGILDDTMSYKNLTVDEYNKILSDIATATSVNITQDVEIDTVKTTVDTFDERITSTEELVTEVSEMANDFDERIQKNTDDIIEINKHETEEDEEQARTDFNKKFQDTLNS